jgi:hypothetical protein
VFARGTLIGTISEAFRDGVAVPVAVGCGVHVAGGAVVGVPVAVPCSGGVPVAVGDAVSAGMGVPVAVTKGTSVLAAVLTGMGVPVVVAARMGVRVDVPVATTVLVGVMLEVAVLVAVAVLVGLAADRMLQLSMVLLSDCAFGASFPVSIADELPWSQRSTLICTGVPGDCLTRNGAIRVPVTVMLPSPFAMGDGNERLTGGSAAASCSEKWTPGPSLLSWVCVAASWIPSVQ